MPRYFIEVSYLGTRYSGFQTQINANTIQAEVEKAIKILLKIKSEEDFKVTGSSRTDAGVHALQNYFHFDITGKSSLLDSKQTFIYKLNAILPPDIAVKNIHLVSGQSHCRFDAVSRSYSYHIYQQKNPFLLDKGFYFPYRLNLEKLKEAASLLPHYHDFTSFSKRNTQAKTFLCKLMISDWQEINDCLVYNVTANRFLRGMVRGLTATMLKVGREKLSIQDFKSIIDARDCTLANFAAPPQALFLNKVNYPQGYFN